MKKSVMLAIIMVVILIANAVLSPASAQTDEPTTQPTVEVTAQPTAEATTEPVEPPPGLPDELPETATEGLNVLALALATLSGLAGTRITNFIKGLAFLQEGERSKLTGIVADLVAFVTSTVIAYLVVWLTPLANTLDSSGLWQVILFSWPTAKAWFEIEARRKANITILEPVLSEPIHTQEK